jgi:hypothetical protein
LFFGYGSAPKAVPPRYLRISSEVSDGIPSERRTYVDAADGTYRTVLHNALFSRESAYDGVSEQRRDRSGGIHALDTPSARRDAVSTSYLLSERFLQRDFGSRSASCRETSSAGRGTVRIVSVTPNGGTPLRLLVDAGDGLLAGATMLSTNGAQALTFADYRTVGRYVLPFSLSESQSADAPVERVLRYTFPSAASQRLTPTAPPNDTSVPSAGVTVPFEMYYGAVVVYARIDGKQPLPFILDTGGHAILTTDAARALGIRTAGLGSSGGGGSGRIGLSYARVDDLSIGAAHVRNQSVLVIPYDKSFSARPPQVPLAGILGLELFERFGIQIDYARRVVVLTPFASTPHDGVALPMLFDDDSPLVPASVDRIDGLFQADTGNSGGTILFNHFLVANGLRKKYGRGAPASGSGTGGPVSFVAERVGSFRIAGRTFDHVDAYFAAPLSRGAFASQTEAGNIGYDILARFVPTFDYAMRRLYLRPASRGPLPLKSLTGLGAEKRSDGSFAVTNVRKGSPAEAAGIVRGDVILSVNGKATARISAPMLWAINRGMDGLKLVLEIGRGTRLLTVTVALHQSAVS